MADQLMRLSEQLAEFGLYSTIAPAPQASGAVERTALRLTHGTSVQEYDLVYGPQVRPADVAPVPERGRCFVYTPHISAKTAATFRQGGVQYLDAVGNAWIQLDRKSVV